MVTHTDISDSSYQKSRSFEYRLSLLVGTDGMAYMVSDGKSQILQLRSFDFAGGEFATSLKSVLSAEEKLQQRYKQVKIAMDSETFTLMPWRLFKAEDRPLYLQKTAQLPEGSQFGDYHLAFNNSQLVYAWDSDKLSLLKNYFPTGLLFHRLAGLLESWHQQAVSIGGKVVFLDVSDNHRFTVALFNGKHLVFCNRFAYQSTEDFVYYTLMVYHRFHLEQEKTPCFLSGSILAESEVFQKLYTYIRHLSFVSPTEYYHFPKGKSGVPQHPHLDLFSLSLCES